jgi:hypothetical protein
MLAPTIVSVFPIPERRPSVIPSIAIRSIEDAIEQLPNLRETRAVICHM